MRPPRLELDGTVLDAPRLDDDEAYLNAHDAGVLRALMLKEAPNIEKVRQWMQLAIDLWNDDTREDWRFAVRAVRGDELVGWLAVRHVAAGYTIETWIGAAHRGLGHGSRALELAARWAFCVRRLPSLRAEILEPNPASIAAAERVGFWATPQLAMVTDQYGRKHVVGVWFLTRRRWLREHQCAGET